MPPLDIQEKFSRQVILPAVGIEGQRKWSESSVCLIGDGAALSSAATAFASSGLGRLFLLPLGPFNPKNLGPLSGLPLEILPEDTATLPSASAVVILTGNKKNWRPWSRQLRRSGKPAFFGWAAGGGYALFHAAHRGGGCPCLECFEILNPKAFARKGQGEGGTAAENPSADRLLGAMAASETLQWLLNATTPLENKVWITLIETGVSFHHEVKASYKCPARLLEEGATVTP